MRLWSLHPSLLDSKGLTACWREGLLAQSALINKGGYYNHSQLQRFKATGNPLQMVCNYLHVLEAESRRRIRDGLSSGRGFRVSLIKKDYVYPFQKINVMLGQLEYESTLFQHKLLKRKHIPYDHYNWFLQQEPKAHHIFEIVPGGIESWERIKQNLTRS